MEKNGNDFNSSVSALLKGLEAFVCTKTVVGEPMKVNDAIILPHVDMKFGIGAGAFEGEKKNNAGGGLGATINPCAVLVIQDGTTKMVSVKNQDVTSKIVDMVPGIINRFTSKGKEQTDPEVEEAVSDILENGRNVE